MTELPMACFVCGTKLEHVGSPSPAHPAGALCFQGTAPYGSCFDQAHRGIGLTCYEIFVCDSCWVQHRYRALGVVKPLRPEPRYFSGKQCEQAAAKARKARCCIRIDLLFPEPEKVETTPDAEPEPRECSWCGEELSDGKAPKSRQGEEFCSVAHRDASSRALRKLKGRMWKSQ